jgi:transposase
MLYVSVSHIPG